MTIPVTPIPKKVIDGSDENLRLFLEFLNGTEESTSNLRQGAWHYILLALYNGSQGNVENINNLLKLSDEKELRAKLESWKQMETVLWDVVD